MRLNPADRDIGTCPNCGKRRYTSRRTARAAGRALHPGAVLRAYRCGQYWHVGNTPRRVKRGLRPPYHHTLKGDRA